MYDKQISVNDMSKSDIVFSLLTSLNMGDSNNVGDRVEYAEMQYRQLVNHGLISPDKK